MPNGEFTHDEIYSQPQVWREALAVFDSQVAAFHALLNRAAPDRVIVAGCGSTYYLALTGARLLRHAGLDAVAVPASELLLFPDSILLPGNNTILITVSRSGTTTETVRAAQQFQRRKAGPIICVTCDGDSPLASAADLVFAIDGAAERSVAQTRSFSSMCLVLQGMAGALLGDDLKSSADLPEICRRLLDEYGDVALSLGSDEIIERFFFLGADALYGIACEAMLKMKEMSLAYSESFHCLEFRHGPMSMAGSGALVIGLVSNAAARHEKTLLREMRLMGAEALAIGQNPGDLPRRINLPADLPAWNVPALHLPILQLMAYHRAMFNDQDPDQPQNLSAVISLDDI